MTAALMRLCIIYFGKWVLSQTTQSFTPEINCNRFLECKQRSYCSGEKRDHIVLLLHGFTTSPMQWEILSSELERNGIDFHAPLIHGFGQIHPEFLQAAGKEDWIRQIVDLYDLFSHQYRRISVIGHSMGGMLACILAQQRPVHELIISGPALFPLKKQGIYAHAMRSRFATALISYLIPMVPKPMRGNRKGPADTLDTAATYQYFQYMVAPVRLMFSMLHAQQNMDYSAMKFDRFTFICGKHDITVDNCSTEKYLASCGLKFHRYRFLNSAHNTFVDFDRAHANTLVIQLLSGAAGELPPPEACECVHYPA
ncbi:MAG: alpha/beta fold hydrolase [Spartobacteria bacterium]|nr:alpha/beta fold hydrolase [Spartobacteria bacterium]